MLFYIFIIVTLLIQNRPQPPEKPEPKQDQTEQLLRQIEEKEAELSKLKSQLSHQRDAYERAQSQINLLGDANAQLKSNLEEEKRISALLSGGLICVAEFLTCSF